MFLGLLPSSTLSCDGYIYIYVYIYVYIYCICIFFLKPWCVSIKLQQERKLYPKISGYTTQFDHRDAVQHSRAVIHWVVRCFIICIVARLYDGIVVSPWNLTAAYPASMSMCLIHFRSTLAYLHLVSWLRDFTRLCDKICQVKLKHIYSRQRYAYRNVTK